MNVAYSLSAFPIGVLSDRVGRVKLPMAGLTLVADERRGTAFGVFNLVTGVSTLFASIIADALRQVAGPQGAFAAGAGFALLTLMGLLSVRGRMDRVGALPEALRRRLIVADLSPRYDLLILENLAIRFRPA